LSYLAHEVEALTRESFAKLSYAVAPIVELMLILTGSATVDPAHRDEAVELATTMSEATRQEPGCIEYRISTDLQDEHTFYFFEVWESKDALDAHFQTEHMANFRSELPRILDGELDVTMYESPDEEPSSE
jgi:quinol monooxygenase YgiN